MRKIRIVAGSVEVTATLLDNRTADAVWQALPLEASAQLWGDEIYFSIPVSLGEEESREVVEAGDLAAGRRERRSASSGGRPRPAGVRRSALRAP